MILSGYLSNASATCFIIISAILSGCIATNCPEPEVLPVVTNVEAQAVAASPLPKEYLKILNDLITENDFFNAKLENEKFLASYKNIYTGNYDTMADFLSQITINQKLLSKILLDKQLNSSLSRNVKLIERENNQARLYTKFLELEKKELNIRITLLEQENSSLKQQIKRMKEIDLNSEKITE